VVQLLHPAHSAASQGLGRVGQGMLSSLGLPRPYGDDAPAARSELWALESAWNGGTWDPATPVLSPPLP